MYHHWLTDIRIIIDYETGHHNDMIFTNLTICNANSLLLYLSALNIFDSFGYMLEACSRSTTYLDVLCDSHRDMLISIGLEF